MPTSQTFKASQFEKVKQAARRRGGTVLEKRYVDLSSPIALRCERGHRFQLSSKNLLRGLWCSECRPIAHQSQYLQIAKVTAQRRGGKCLSETYENARTKLKWRCKAGHRWEASLDNVLNKGSWCPTCAVGLISDRKKRWWRQARRQQRG